jgi:hypothetical protein
MSTTKPFPLPTLQPYTNRSSQQPKIQRGRQTMREARPIKTIEEAQRRAEKMGYHLIKTPIRYGSLIHSCSSRLLSLPSTLKKIRYAIDENAFVEHLFPEKVDALRFPLPLHVLRELWIRMQNEWAWRWLYILTDTTAEIEFNTAENYRNTHLNDEMWRHAPFRIDIPLPPKKRDECR